MKATEYLSAVKAKRNLSSDYKLAQVLKVPTSLMTRYMRGDSVPGPVVAFRVAEILGEQPAAVVAEFEAERAEKMGKESDADEWRSILKRIGGAAASVLLAVGIGAGANGGAGSAHAATRDTSYTSYEVSDAQGLNDG